ncbi:MAG TPA: CopG family transcriptional regulator [Rhizomicrobium sp.]
MSFAPITSALLARKGDAGPSQAAKRGFFWQAKSPADKPASRPGHRISLALSQSEHQALGLVAVKKGITRHQLLRQALERHLAQLALEYGGCACIAKGDCSARDTGECCGG